MKVAELIELLANADLNSEVIIFIHGDDEPITGVEFGGNQQPTVLYYGEDQ